MNMPGSLKIEIKTVNELSDELAQYIQNCHEREFRNDSMVYAHPEIYILGYLNDKPVTQAGILQRTITVDGKPLLIGGVSFLITEPEYRGHGFASLVMKEAVSFLNNELSLGLVLLTCKPRLESLYNGMGWRTVAGPTVFVQPTGMRACGGLTMVHESAGTTWPEGEIDLCGLPW